MKRPLQLVIIPVQETEVWRSDTYRMKYDIKFIAMPGVSVDRILEEIKNSSAWGDKTYDPPADPNDYLFGDYILGRSFKFFQPKVSVFKERLDDSTMNILRKESFIDL